MPNMILPLARDKDPIWKQKFQNIKKITPEIKKLVRDMRETLELTSAVGLAAPQVGKPLRLFIANYGHLKEVFINPWIASRGKETNPLEEGCLSVPCTRGEVARSKEVEIEYLDLKGHRKVAKLAGYYARIAQHEYDHLSSVFYADRILDKKKVYKYKPIKIVFFGTPEFGAIILKSLIGQQIVGEYTIPLVVTALDKPAGRGRQLTASQVKKLASEFGLPVETLQSLKGNTKFISKLKSISPDFIVLASYGKIIPREILEIPTKAPINIHPSLLPKYRGPSPISAAILAGNPSTGVTIMAMNEKMDEGDILAAAKVRISSRDTTESLGTKLANLGATLVLHVLHLMTLDKIQPQPQDSRQATYTKILEKKDGYIDWKKPPENLERMTRAYHPWPGAWTYYLPVQQTGQQTANREQRTAKKILKLLPNHMAQLEGKNPVSLEEFKRGHSDFTLSW